MRPIALLGTAAFVALLIVAPGLAAPTVSGDRTHDAAFAPAIAWDVAFRVSREQDAGIKIVAGPENPAFNNGTPGVSGWWASAAVDRGSGFEAAGATDGKEAIGLGPFSAGIENVVRITLHVAADAAPGEYRVYFALFTDPDEEGPQSGSGAVLQPSETLVLRIHPDDLVAEGAAPADPAGGTPGAEATRIVLVGAAAGAVAVLASTAVALAVHRRGRG